MTSNDAVPEPPNEAADTSIEKSLPASDCVRLASFESAESVSRWQTVNDNVMGGQSLGGPAFGEGSMIFSGEINTDGGGFSSLRLSLDEGALADVNGIMVRAKPDGRSYDLTFRDSLPNRNRGVMHRAALPLTATGEWETVTVRFDQLYSTIFGQPVEVEPFRPDLAEDIGIMISDGIDGPFALEVEWIDGCA